MIVNLWNYLTYQPNPQGKNMGMNINLTETLEELVRNKVASGLYNSASEVVRDALRLMQEQDEYRAVRLNQLKSEIQQGFRNRRSMAR